MTIDQGPPIAELPKRATVSRTRRRQAATASAGGTDLTHGLSPTSERHQHGQDLRPANVINDDGVHGRSFRVASALYQLRKANKIAAAAEHAAVRWYRDYAFSEGASDPGAGRAIGRSDIHDMMIARSESSARRTEVRKALGFCAEMRLKMLMADCLSFTAMGAALKLDRKQVSAQMILLLEMLTEFYAAQDRRRSSRPRPA